MSFTELDVVYVWADILLFLLMFTDVNCEFLSREVSSKKYSVISFFFATG